MTEPRRIQLRRTRGWLKPTGAVVVSRPSRYGNPFPASGDRALAVARFREWIEGPHSTITAEDLESLRGKDLCCWCPLDGPCHADVLLELANR
jgi:hypothetical protein